MTTESLSELQAAFAEWRRNKKCRGEAIPSALLLRARRVAGVLGAEHVMRKLGIARVRLTASDGEHPNVVSSPLPIPRFTRIEIAPPPRPESPLVEAEAPSGLKLRLFAITSETEILLSSFCRMAGGNS